MADDYSNTQFYNCDFCQRRDISELSSFIPQSRRIIHDSSPGLIHNGFEHTVVLSIDKRFVIFLKFNKRHSSSYPRSQSWAEYCKFYSLSTNLDVFDLLENKLTEFWCSESQLDFNGLNFTTILKTIKFCKKGRFRKLKNDLFAYCNRKCQAVQGPVPIFVCLILLNTETKTFTFCDLVVLKNKSDGSLGYTIDSDDRESPNLKIKFVVKDGESTTIETHHYQISNNRFIFIDKTVTPTYNFNPDHLRDYHVFNKKGYKFISRMRESEHIERPVLSMNYSYVYVCDLENLQDEPKFLLTRYHRYEELNAPIGDITDEKWSDCGFMFVSIFSESLQHFNIYRFDATSLKWNRIEWLQLPINHIYADDEDYPDICRNTQILAVTSANTLFLRSQINVEKDGQKKLHRNYYRLTVGRSDSLRDLSWFKVQKSDYKHLLREVPFNSF